MPNGEKFNFLDWLYELTEKHGTFKVLVAIYCVYVIFYIITMKLLFLFLDNLPYIL